MYFIDKNGDVVNSSWEGRTISTSLDVVKQLENVIGVAAGQEKVNAIRSALNGRYLDVLITDEGTANSLI